MNETAELITLSLNHGFEDAWDRVCSKTDLYICFNGEKESFRMFFQEVQAFLYETSESFFATSEPHHD